MKVAVSVPDTTFQLAERLARRLKMSRSGLYSRALDEYIARHDPDAVTETVDRVCDGLEPGVDPFTKRAGRRTFERGEW